MPVPARPVMKTDLLVFSSRSKVRLKSGVNSRAGLTEAWLRRLISSIFYHKIELS